MLLNRKKNTARELKWSVVLSSPAQPPQPEVLARKIAQLFDLSETESVNIAENMPIVLIDNLSGPAAEKIKKELDATGAGIFITTDESLTRKCSKTLWPDSPDLSRFEEGGLVQGSSSAEVSAAELEAPEAQSEPSDGSAHSVSEPIEYDKPLAEQLRLYQDQLTLAQTANWQLEETLKERLVKMEELRVRAADLEQKLTDLETQRRSAEGQQIHSDASLQNLLLENQQLKMSLQKAEEERLGQEEQFREQHSKHVRIEKEFLETHREQEERIRSLQVELDETRQRNERLAEERNGLEQSQGQVDEALNECRKEVRLLNEKNALILEQYAAIERAVADERYRRGEAEKALAGFDECRAYLEESVRKADAGAAELCEKNRMLAEQYDALERAAAEERVRRQALEDALADLQTKLNGFDDERRQLTQKIQMFEEEKLQLENTLKMMRDELEGYRHEQAETAGKAQESEQRMCELAARNDELARENQALAGSLIEAKNYSASLETQHHRSLREVNDMFLGAQAELEKLRGRVKDLEGKLIVREQDNDQMSRFLRERLHELNDCRDQYDKLLAQSREWQTLLAQEKELRAAVQAECDGLKKTYGPDSENQDTDRPA